MAAATPTPMLFKVKEGFHSIGGADPESVLKQGDIVRDSRQLDQMFPGKFQRVIDESKDVRVVDAQTRQPVVPKAPAPVEDEDPEVPEESETSAEPMDVTKDFIAALGKTAKVFLMPDKTFTVKDSLGKALLEGATKQQANKFLKAFEKE